MKEVSYQKTIYACFMGYIAQAIAVNFAPLLFLRFRAQYGIPLSEITALITICFVLQLMTDLVSTFFVDRIGYRAAVLLANTFVAAGFMSLTFLPELTPNPFLGLVISVIIYSVGSGLIEVVVSPMVEACPSANKSKTMSLLHSFYCWGSVGVVVVSTAFFRIFGIDKWKLLAGAWAVLPLINAVLFANTPIPDISEQQKEQISFGELLKNRVFWIFFVIMLCAGASEIAVSQWASAFAEKMLDIPKSAGDIAGPAMFAVLMGTARTLYGKYGEKVELGRMIFICSLLCILSYLMISLSPNSIISVMGIGLCGFSVGIMWPGTFSLAAASVKGGNAMFALLALAGDIGCTAGPTLAGLVAEAANDNLKLGILSAIIFPTILAVMIFPKIRKK